MAIKRISMMLTILGFVLIWFGVNQSNDIMLVVAMGLIFTGLTGLYWGFRTMRGAGILQGNRLFFIVAGIFALLIIAGVFLGF